MISQSGETTLVPGRILLIGTAILLVAVVVHDVYSWRFFLEAPLIDRAGRQRMLAQRLAKELLLLDRSAPQERADIRMRVLATGETLVAVHESLLKGNAGLEIPKPTEPARKLLLGIGSNIESIARTLEAIRTSPPETMPALVRRDPRKLVKHVDDCTVAYEALLHLLVAESRGRRELNRWAQRVLLGWAFLLLASAALLYRRAYRRSAAVSAELEAKNASLAESLAALRKSEDGRLLMTQAVAQASESIIITDATGRVEYVNDAFETNTGFPREEIVGRTQNILSSGKQDAQFYASLWDRIASGKSWRGRIVNRHKNGTLRTENLSISPITDKTGRIAHYVGIKQDMTHELEMEQQLLQAQKMEAIGTLAGGIAHDLNNILTPMVGYVELAQRELPEHSPVRGYVGQIRAAALRAERLIRQVLGISRAVAVPIQEVRLDNVVKDALALMQSAVPANISTRLEIAPDLPGMLGDAAELDAAISNLCINAIHAMPEGGTLTLRLSCVDATGLAISPKLTVSGPMLELVVADTGIGLDEATLQRIFEPFFTTRPVGQGTGLGLMRVYSIVRQHHGHIQVTSAPRRGTAFTLLFPVVPSAAGQN